MGRACSVYGGEEIVRERYYLEDIGVDGEYNFEIDLKEVGCGGMDWIDLTLDRDRWRALVNAVTNLQVPQKAVNFLAS